MINRNERSIALDLRDEDDRATLLALCADADVLAEGFRPGSMTRLSLGYERLAELNPRLIYCSINGFGSSGGSDHSALTNTDSISSTSGDSEGKGYIDNYAGTRYCDLLLSVLTCTSL